MTPFLKNIAQVLLDKHGIDLSDVCIVFPNKRASIFLNQYLAEVAGRGTIWAPTYITISELFRQNSQLKVADPIKLVCDIHKSFVACTGIDETLDHFYGWGQLLIADFDDIDKNLADPAKVFANLQDIHELDDISYLTDEQKKMIQKFFANFSADHNSELKKRFLQLWSHLHDIYTDFNTRLAQQGLAYEGALYRQVVENKDLKFEHKMYYFVGFNMMQKVELQLCDRIEAEGKADFFWDFDAAYVSNPRQEAGHYIRQYLKRYPTQVDPAFNQAAKNLEQEKQITFISAPTENIQARYVRQWLMENKRYTKGNKVAIVLADESLLPSVIHSVPNEVNKLNVTIGYPLQQTPFYSLIQQLMQLQSIGHPKHSATYRLHYVLKVLRHPYARYISAQYSNLLKDLEENKRFYPSRSSLILEGDEGLALLFSDLEQGVSNTDDYNIALLNYLLSLLKQIGVNAKEEKDPLFHESLYRTYTLLNRLHALVASHDLSVDTLTLERLIQQLFQTTNIPFHGEPAEGIQVMGVLETRNLDFEEMLILSCNEGNLPKGVNDSSFIPYSIRKAYGLTTVDNKVAIYAYYFYRMIQRASNITFTYNNATEDGQSGEMSRFMLQLMVESKHPVKRLSMMSGLTPMQSEYVDVEKTQEMLDTLSEIHLITPTLLNTYQRCEKRFYYKYVRGLQEPDEIDEDEVDNRVFGNIFHRAAELYYLQFAPDNALTTDRNGKTQLLHPIIIGKDAFEHALKDKTLIDRLVDQAFREELFKVSDQGYKPKYNGLQLINKEVIASYLRQLVINDSHKAPFTIIGLELVVSTQLDITLKNGYRKFRVGGFIDRLDAVAANGNPGMSNLAEQVRVIDYKTGHATTGHPKDLAEVFNPAELVSKHTDYYLQAMLYSIIVKNDPKLNKAKNPVSPGLLFIQNARSEDYDPTLKIGRDPIKDVAVYEKEFMEGISRIIADIYDKEQPFHTTIDKQRCLSCPYAALCK